MLRQFLNLLAWLRHILLQDMAMLFSQKPSCPVFHFPLFYSTAFRSLAEHSQKIVAKAVEDACLNAQNLPDQFVASIQGVMASVQLNQEVRMEQLEHSLAGLREQVTRMEGVMGVLAMTERGSRHCHQVT